MSKYDLLILDYGGVYSFDYDPASFNQIMLSVFDKQPNEQEKERIFSVAALLGTNKITSEEYVRHVAGIMQSPVPASKAFEEAVISHSFPPSEAMVELVGRAKERGIKVSILSDMYLFELEKMRPTGRYEGFDYTSFSSEIGYMKDSPEAYMLTLSHFGVEPGKALFVDDRQPFVEEAQSLGIDTLCACKSDFKNAQQLANAISKRIGIT